MDISRNARTTIALCVALFATTVAAGQSYAASGPQARLVHCGAETCMRIAGHRAHAGVAIRVGGDTLAVEGGRNWRVTVPLATARGWATSSGRSLTVALADPRTGTETAQAVALPPGALGRRVELATLLVAAH